MFKVELCYDGASQTIQLEKPTPVFKLLPKTTYPVYACTINNEIARLNAIIEKQAHVELLDIRTNSANLIYQYSLTLLYIKAVGDVLGKQIVVEICNSLSKGLYTEIHGPTTQDTAQQIEHRMHELVKENLPITCERISKQEVIETLHKEKQFHRVKTYESASDIVFAYRCILDDTVDYMFAPLVPSTKYLTLFEVKRYKNGFILRFPHPSDPNVVLPFAEQKLLYNAFAQSTRWNQIIGVNYARDLNEKIKHNQVKELVLLSEALHEKNIAEIAQQIFDQNKRMILIAGPSSSGKTSFANRLMIQLKVLGLKPLYMGTDDYFVNNDQTPLKPNGDKDFESIDALDLHLLQTQMQALLNCEKVDMPRFDFKLGKKIFHERIVSIQHDQPIVMEGIHALNPRLLKNVETDSQFKIYISPLTELNIDEHHRIPTTDARILRRMVRDNQFRNFDAEQTILNWHNVREGEENYIFPFNEEADVFFNSNCIYELAVMKKYAKPLLEKIDQTSPAYPEAKRLLEFLTFFECIEDETIISNNSIIREFLGDSVLFKQ